MYLDRLFGYLSQYLCKLLSSLALSEIDGIVFSGGIGEKGARLRRDVLERFAWLGTTVDERQNEHGQGAVREITVPGSKLGGWVVETDEEGFMCKVGQGRAWILNSKGRIGFGFTKILFTWAA